MGLTSAGFFLSTISDFFRSLACGSPVTGCGRELFESVFSLLVALLLSGDEVEELDCRALEVLDSVLTLAEFVRPDELEVAEAFCFEDEAAAALLGGTRSLPSRCVLSM